MSEDICSEHREGSAAHRFILYDRCVCTNVSTTVCVVCLEDIAQVMQMTCINVPQRCLMHISVLLSKTYSLVHQYLELLCCWQFKYFQLFFL